jgi:hypothetical protein
VAEDILTDLMKELEEDGWEAAEGGSFLSWGAEAGQTVFGDVVRFDPTGGKDYNGEEAISLIVALDAPSYSVKKSGERTDFDEGDVIDIQGPPSILSRKLLNLRPDAGDKIFIRAKGLVKTKKGNEAKDFDVRLRRKAGALGAAA